MSANRKDAKKIVRSQVKKRLPKKTKHKAKFHKQLNYLGLVEEVSAQTYLNKLVCKCGNIRWVKNADLFQVKKCKPCTYRDRKERRKKRRATQ